MKRFGTTRMIAGLALAGIVPFCGCVAVNVGDPKVYTHTDTHFETGTSPSATRVETARAQMNQTGTGVIVGIAADVLEEYPKMRWEETTTIRIQKRLGIGLFPGASEVYLTPKGALHPALFRNRNGGYKDGYACALYETGEDSYPLAFFGATIASFGLLPTLGTLNTLLVQPFAGWSCDHDFIDEECMEISSFSNASRRKYADAAASPKIRAFKSFTAEERKQMGVVTCYDRHGRALFSTAGMTHVGLIGCHKHQAVFVEPAKPGSRTETGEAETKCRHVDVEGPYVAELSIPAMGYVQEVRVGKGAKRAIFEFPDAERKHMKEVVLRFRPDGPEVASEVTKAALEKVIGQEYRFDVVFQEMAGAIAVQPVAAVPASPVVGTPASPSVKKTGIKASRQAYEVVGITMSENGQCEVRVRIADKSKTFDIGWAVEPDVKRRIREDFVNRHPGTGIQYVREMVEWETEEEGAILVYRGWAFSARPVSDGWTYDDGSRRGTVRLRISEGMPAEEAKRWARENIEAIVKEKNVALEAGTEPPSGAMYRSLGESLEDGVLTVEFEAVE